MLYPENKEFQFLLDQVKNAIGHELPVCLYRKPNQDEVKAVFQDSGELIFTTDFQEMGFVFAPFDLNDNAVRIKPDKVLSASYTFHSKKKESVGLAPTKNGKSIHLDLVRKGLEAITTGEFAKGCIIKKN